MVSSYNLATYPQGLARVAIMATTALFFVFREQAERHERTGIQN